MALQKENVQLDNGLVAPITYSKITSLYGNKEIMTVQIKSYASKVIADANGKEITSMSYDFVPDASEGAINYHTQAYEFAKTQPFFKDAIDV